MIFNNSIDVIIMLCRVREAGKSQSDCYWKQNEEIDNISININGEEEINKSLTKRTFTLIQKNTEDPSKESQSKTVIQYHWVGWPDHGVPSEEEYENIEKLIDIIVEERKNKIEKAICIHCSAGIGRSGTLIALYNMEQIMREGISKFDEVKITVFGTVRRLREQRWGMVNTPDQYAFIYKHISEKIEKQLKELEGNKEKESSN